VSIVAARGVYHWPVTDPVAEEGPPGKGPMFPCRVVGPGRGPCNGM